LHQYPLYVSHSPTDIQLTALYANQQRSSCIINVSGGEILEEYKAKELLELLNSKAKSLKI